MFTKGQQLFALIFAIVFIMIVAWSYRKDLKLHKIYYKNVWVVGLTVVAVIILFAAIAYIVQH
ncbi:MAG: hypothetical protein CSA39_01530 [Flavobacteriales bacterium]|nr:MAG: hypothetical protein CR989_00035 [Flavobacteriales bacterium]PIE49662.1 MAG: hypothetical protein CSA39_01530 [Flavobacteriales bacterium]